MSKAEIFSYFTETEVLSSVFPEIRALPCLVNSPLRVDRSPSFRIYMSDAGHVRYIDFATGDRGTLLDLLCAYWHCSLGSAIDHLGDVLTKGNGMPAGKAPQASGHKMKARKGSGTRLEVKVREWRDYDMDYWQSYGCNVGLLKYCEVYPISHKIIYKEGRKYTFAAPKYCYAYIERKENKVTKKIYAPFAKQYKWVTDADGSVVGLWGKVPETGDRLCICSSLKDAVCLWSNTGIPSVYIQGEAFGMSDTAVKVLKQRYKRIYICLDNDEAGLKDARKLAQRTGFVNVVLPPFKGGKDISDYYKSLDNKEDFKQLKNLFI